MTFDPGGMSALWIMIIVLVDAVIVMRVINRKLAQKDTKHNTTAERI